MFDFYQHCEDNDLSSSFVLVISPLNALMIDQITKLKDHVNVSIMKAHVDESKDEMYTLIQEPVFMDNDSSIITIYGQYIDNDSSKCPVYGQRFQ